MKRYEVHSGDLTDPALPVIRDSRSDVGVYLASEVDKILDAYDKLCEELIRDTDAHLEEDAPGVFDPDERLAALRALRKAGA